MKLRPFLLAAACVTAAASAQTTQSYTDGTDEIAVPGSPFPHLDLTGVDVTVDAEETGITFRLNLAASPIDTNWGKYMIAIRSNPGGSTTSNGWGRPITMAGGMTHWIGSWVDDGGPSGAGAQLWTFNGSSWNLSPSAPSISRDATGITISLPVANLNLAPGEVFSFDVYSSGGGGGDSAVDALSTPTSSITNWATPYTTAAVDAETQAALAFTMPGTPDLATWAASFGLVGSQALPDSDPDFDGLTNQQEFDLGIGLDPTLPDSDFDGLLDGVETLTGIFVSPTDTGTNPMDSDTDNDGTFDGDEVAGTGISGYIQDPNHFNHEIMAVAGSFNLPTPWDSSGDSTPTNRMTRVGTSLTEQYQWTLDAHLTQPKTSITYKLAAGSWIRNWGSGPTPGTLVPNGGDIVELVTAGGIHRFSFDTISLGHTFTRVTFDSLEDYLAAYGLADSPDGDADGDNVSNADEFAANSDPTLADTDGDGLLDNVDPNPIVPEPESRTVVFQVDMSVAASQGDFTPGTSTVRVIGQFDGWNTAGGVVLSDPDSDGVYTGNYTAVGFEGTSFGFYKFFIDGGPNGGYEQGDDRTFNLGADAVTQTLPVVYFSNIGPSTGFTAWIESFPGLSDTSRNGDPDGDGLSNETEFLFGSAPDAANPGPALASPTAGGILIRWNQLGSGASYTLQQSSTLHPEEWDPSPLTPSAADDQSGVPSGYTRLEVIAPFESARRFFRVFASEN